MIQIRNKYPENNKVKKGFMDMIVNDSQRRRNENKKKVSTKQKWFCPVYEDFYFGIIGLKRCKLCNSKHHDIIYNKKLHDKYIYGEK